MVPESLPQETSKRALVLRRFWSKVDKTGECWEWTGAMDSSGYGHFHDGRKHCGAHRFSHEATVGPIPKGLEIDHRCHNRACVRPDHLRVVTRKQNAENKSGPMRNNRSSGIRGVSWRGDKKRWHAQVGHLGRRHHAGYFTTLAEAETAVAAMRNALHTHNEGDRALPTQTTPTGPL